MGLTGKFSLTLSIFTFSGPLGLYSRIQNHFESRLGLGCVRDVASAIISHEQT